MYVYMYTIHHILTIYFSRKATQKLFIKMIINYDESDKFFVIVFFRKIYFPKKIKARNSTATAMDGDVFSAAMIVDRYGIEFNLKSNKLFQIILVVRTCMDLLFIIIWCCCWFFSLLTYLFKQ